MPAKARTNAQKLNAAERRAYALQLRRGGAKYRSIAAAVREHFPKDILPQNYDERWAWNDVAYEMERLQKISHEDAEAMRQLEMDRLEDLTLTLWPMCLGGDIKAIMAYLKVAERRAKLVGLDMPTKIAPTDPTGENPYERMSDEERMSLISEMLDKLGISLPPEPTS